MIEPQRGFPELRLRALNDAAVNRKGAYVLYWMTAFRRPVWNFSLQRAADWARSLDCPLLVFEGLRCDYRWASDRLHQFVIEGMQQNQEYFRQAGVGYLPYLEPAPGQGRGLLAHLAKHAAVVIADDFPCFFLPRMVRAAAQQLDVKVEAIDANGLLPLRAADRVFPTAHSFRRFLQRQLRPHLNEFPDPHPSEARLVPFGSLPRGTSSTWPTHTPTEYLRDTTRLHDLPIDHDVRPSCLKGGFREAAARLDDFIADKLSEYGERRNHPDDDVASGLSPYLHFGHVSAHEIFDQVMRHDGWDSRRLATQTTGSREGWWGASETVEAFLDELITWREVGYNFCWQRADYDQFGSLPDWSRKTLREHEADQREFVYTLEQFEQADTHDELWNAAQRQLVREGRIHNYLRMLWGKKILHWTRSPQHALEIMIELNNKYALDGRNPNSYSGIFWVLGRYDRAWGPERPIFGKVRYMTSDSTRKKLRLSQYLDRYRQIQIAVEEGSSEDGRAE